MADYTEEQLENMTDEELEAAANEARASDAQENEDTTEENISDNEPENVDDGSQEEENLGDDTNVATDNDESEVEPDDEVEEENSETSESGEENPDGETEPKKDDKEEATPDTPIENFAPLKVSGKQIPINSLEELYTLASGGAAVTQKFQEIAGHKKSIAIMQDHNLTEADLSLLVEAKNGSKDALASLVKQSGIDSLEVTDEVSEGYKPGAYIPSDQQISLQEVQHEISRDEEYAVTQNVVNNILDERSQDMLVQNPQMIRGLHEDIKSGAYLSVSAHAQKLKLMDGGRRSDMEYYIQAAQEGPSPQDVPAVPAAVVPEQQSPKKKVVSKDKRKAAASNRNSNKAPSIKDINDMTDEELMAYREKIMERY
jgi:hypothetical protein